MDMKDRAKLNTRPQSARTQDTKLTLQSESNVSTFSETDTFAVKKRNQHDDFGQHIEKLNKQQRFRHLAGPLPTISEKKENEEFKNQTCKPFEARRTSNAKKPVEKVEPPVIKAEKSSLAVKVVKPDQVVDDKSTVSQKSNKFIEKSIRKMNELVSVNGNSEMQRADPEAVRLNFVAFVSNDPVKRRHQLAKAAEEKKEQELKGEEQRHMTKKSSQKKQTDPNSQKLEEMARQQNQRRLRNAQLSQYVNERQLRNMDNFPQGYEVAIERISDRLLTEHNMEELDSLDVSQFNSNQLGDRDIVSAMGNIRQLDRKIERVEKNGERNKLEEVDQLEYSHDSEHPSLTTSSLSTLKKNNNLFLTQILKGNASQHDIQALLQMEKLHVKLIKLEEDELASSSSEEDNQKPRPNNRILERNKIEAVGGLYQECDYLSEEHKKRLAQLMADIESGLQPTTTPFDLSEVERHHLIRLDQGLEVYQSIFQTSVSSEPVIYQQNLPKDPVLRRQSEMKILKDKITSVNNGLRNLHKVPVDRFKIQSLIERLQQMGVTQPSSTIIQEVRREFDEIKIRVEESEQFLESSLANRADIIAELDEVKKRLNILEGQLQIINEMSDEQLKELQRREIEERRNRVERYQQIYKVAQDTLHSLQNYTDNLRRRIRQIDDIDEVTLQKVQLVGLNLNETEEELDMRLTKKAQGQPPQ